jgi:hypothetical protein
MTSHPPYLRKVQLHVLSFFAPRDSKSFGFLVSAIRSQVQAFSTRFGFGITPAPAPEPEHPNPTPDH